MRGILTAFALSLATPSAFAQLAYESLPILQARFRHQMVGTVGRVLVTGGNQGRSWNEFPDVWELSATGWNRLGDLGFPSLLDGAAFDSRRNVLLGLDGGGSFGFVLVEWQGAGPTFVTNEPPSLYFCDHHQITFDAARGACVMRGYEASTNTNELWSYDGTTWQSLAIQTGGPGYGEYRLLPAPGGSLLLVGQAWGSSSVETWRWQAGTWAPQTTPALDWIRFDATTDPATGQPLLAGYAPAATVMSVFGWSGAAWSQLGTGGPDLGSGFRIAHDGTRLVAFGGIVYGTPHRLLGDTWTFANGVFTQIGSSPPGALDPLATCYDEARRRTVLFGGKATTTETWEWDGAQFQLLHTQAGLTPAHLVYDRGRGVVVQYRGDGRTQEWNGATWTTTVAAGAGPVRHGAGLGYDGQRVILFGGTPAGSYGNETWAYDGVAWTQLSPSVSPPTGIWLPELVEDRRRGVLVMVPSLHGAIYEWNGSTWSTAIPTSELALRQETFAAFHPARGRVVFGGGQHVRYSPSYRTSPALEVFEWDGTTLVQAPNLPSPWEFSSAAATPSGELLVAGGYDGSHQLHVDMLQLGSAQPASLRTFGRGCASAAGVPMLDGDPWRAPWLGDRLEVRCTGLPAASPAALWIAGLSNTQDPLGPLPRSLSPLGAPGCEQRIAVDQPWVMPAVGGTSVWTQTVPLVTALVGVRIHLQTLALDPTANPSGLVVSDAATLTVGAH